MFGCSTTGMSTILSDSRMEVRRYRRMDINGFHVVLEKSFFLPKGLKIIGPDGSLHVPGA